MSCKVLRREHSTVPGALGAGLCQAPGVRQPRAAMAQPPRSPHWSCGIDGIQAQSEGRVSGHRSPTVKVLGWEPNSAPYVFCVLGQVTTPYQASISPIVG